MAVFSPIWSHTWPQWTVKGETHECHSYLDPCCPFQVLLDMPAPFRPTKRPQISLDLAVPTQTPWLFSSRFGVIHGPSGL
jgi:hypothetical protein